VRGVVQDEAHLKWIPATDTTRRTHADLQEATELGACGLAILLAFRCTDWTFANSTGTA
jgi:hypothetical protein